MSELLHRLGQRRLGGLQAVLSRSGERLLCEQLPLLGERRSELGPVEQASAEDLVQVLYLQTVDRLAPVSMRLTVFWYRR